MSATSDISRQRADGMPRHGGGDLADTGERPPGYLAAELSMGIARLPFIGAAIRRRARFWCATAVAGLALGGALYVVHPPAYQASTSVLITQNPVLNPQDAVLTDVALAQTRSVAGPVVRQLGLTEDVTKFTGSYTVAAITDRVLLITVSAPSSAQAVSRAAALATEFLKVRAHVLRVEQQRVASSLNTSISKAKRRASGQEATTALAGLQQAAASYVDNSQVTSASMIAGSRVLDAAAPLPRSKMRSPAVYAIAGALAGLAVGIAIVAIGELTSGRLRRRDDVAIALGAPVELSAGSPPRRGPRGLARAHSEGIQRIVRHLHRAVVAIRAGDTAALAVVAVDKPQVAALSVAALAMSLADEGKRVLVADLAAGSPAARLLGVRAPGVVAVTVDRRQLTVAVPDRGDFTLIGPVGRTHPDPAGRTHPDPAGHHPAARARAGADVPSPLAAAYDSADVLVSLVTLDPALGGEHLPTWAASAVVMVTAGASSETKIRTAGEMIRLVGTPLISAILLDADEADESLGMRFKPELAPST